MTTKSPAPHTTNAATFRTVQVNTPGLNAEDMPSAAGRLIGDAALALRSIDHVPDLLDGLGDLYVTVVDDLGEEHTAVWTYQHDGLGGGSWRYNGNETLRSVRAAVTV